jgi:hypothetical protein
VNPGSILFVRNRHWVLLPNDDPIVYLLRPLAGATDETVAIHRGLSDLIGYSLPVERLQSSTFSLPTEDDLSNASSAHLLWQAARLALREGASPLRSLGRISIRPIRSAADGAPARSCAYAHHRLPGRPGPPLHSLAGFAKTARLITQLPTRSWSWACPIRSLGRRLRKRD